MAKKVNSVIVDQHLYCDQTSWTGSLYSPSSREGPSFEHEELMDRTNHVKILCQNI